MSQSCPDPNPPLYAAAPRWRREPYRLFFALGLVHAWAGVTPWFLMALGLLDEDRRIYHSIAQIQGFMICFAVGFLFTMIPRRTRADAPAAWQMVLGLLCPLGTTVCAAFKMFSWSQAFWLLLVVVLGSFLVRCVRQGTAVGAALQGLVYVPIAIVMGLLGSSFFAVYGATYGVTGARYPSLHVYGQLFLLQGMFLALSIGISGMVFSTLTGVATGGSATGHRFVPWLAAIGLAASFVVEVETSLRGAYTMRAAIVLLVLLWNVRIHRPPELPGINRLLMWGTAWMLPLGYGLAAVYPGHAAAGLHVTFIGGFASMAFAVGMHVAIAHDGRRDLLARWPLPVIAYSALFLFATVARTLMEFDLARRDLWMGWSSGTFLLGTMCWALLAIPALVPRRESR